MVFNIDKERRRLLAQGGFCSVEECACGVLHVTVGVITIRLQADVLASVHETLGEALARLARLRSTGATPLAERPS